MKFLARKLPYKRIALVLSVCALLFWAILGTGVSLAWFVDVSHELNNIFHVGKFELTVSHRLSDGTWEEVDSQTKVFDEEALYEPGYTQVVYLKVENTGTVPFELSTAVNVNGCIVATNVFGHEFMLQEYLKFGLVLASSEEAVSQVLPNRISAAEIANMPLHNYHSETAQLEPGATQYLALIVRMPEEVDNIANYRGDTVPKVELGVTIKADQIRE